MKLEKKLQKLTKHEIRLVSGGGGVPTFGVMQNPDGTGCTEVGLPKIRIGNSQLELEF
ncbi:hypothetical protein [Riemerella anatipestifer]|uniref:hypothetical protein n=1 Tax=Riemerella anatipestifer TaxID=34085 RepID=UPI0023639828|nr:hypothetical protein [Riemerella anatipestifer]